MQKTLKWSAAQPLKRPDYIISSKARETGDYGFKPSYLSEPKESMRFILSNEYMRIWYKERSKYEKNTYSREQIIKEESKIRRRFVQRMMTYRRPDKNYVLEEKVAARIVNKKENEEGPIDYRKYKYKPSCSKLTKMAKFKEKRAGGQVSNNDEDDSENVEESPAVIVCQADPNCCVPYHCCT